jgi:predicted amidohydrolase YtcJ
LHRKANNRREFIAAGAALALAGRMSRVAAQDGTRGPASTRGPDGARSLIGATLARPDYALVNGNFIDDRGRVGDTLAVSGDRIAAVGFGPELAAELPLLDLGGRSVIPGFVDAHVHFTRAGVNPGFQARRIERAFSIAELQQVLADRAASVPAGEFITCIGGWNHNQLAERRAPTLAELDAAAPDHAVYLAATGGGTGAIANRRAAGFFTANGVEVDPETGRVAAAGAALAALQAVQTEADRLRGTAELNAHAASLGLTTVVNAGNLEDQTYPLALWRSGRLDLRMRPLYPADSPADVGARAENLFAQAGRAVGDDWYRPAGFGERIGGSNTMSAQFEPTALAIARAGWLLQQHSISATENAFHLAAFERIAREQPIADLHWALFHLQEISAEAGP